MAEPLRAYPTLACVRCRNQPADVGADFCRPCIDEIVGREVTDHG